MCLNVRYVYVRVCVRNDATYGLFYLVRSTYVHLAHCAELCYRSGDIHTCLTERKQV